MSNSIEQHNFASLVWIDIETSGLDRTEDFILEVFARATNDNLEEVGIQDFHVLIRNPGSLEDAFKRMFLQPKVLDMHARSGLLSELAGNEGQAPVLTLMQAKQRFRSFIDAAYAKTREADGEHERLNLAGSSVDFDRGFLVEKGFIEPSDDKISHRVLDVSSLMVGMATLGWTFDKVSDSTHRAKDDALSSLEKFRSLRSFISSGDGRDPLPL